MMMTLGFFVFSLKTASYQQLQRQTTWRHSKAARIGQRPQYQYLGPGEDTISLSGVLYPEITGGRSTTLDLLRVMAEEGKAWPLIEGTGRMYGFWAITSVSETDSNQLRDGAPQKVDFDIQLTRVDDKEMDALSAGIATATDAATAALAAPLNSARDIL